MARIQTRTTYLQMFAPPPEELAAPRADIHITRLSTPSPERYRGIYRGVGAELYWVDRLVMPDEQLRRILDDPRVEVFLLAVAGGEAGFAELDRRQAEEVELAYFGLFPEYIGQGLGKYFLNWALRTAWSHQPRRVWVHTCDLDHPAALPNYLRAGLHVYEERIVDQFVPDP